MKGPQHARGGGYVFYGKWERNLLKRCFSTYSEKQTILLLKLAEVHTFVLALRLKAKGAAFPGFLAVPKGYSTYAMGNVI